MSFSLDDTDRAMLRLLKQDGRLAVSNIAQELGLSRVTAQKRLKALTDSGVIRKFTVDVNQPTDEDLIRAVTLISVQGTVSETVQRAIRKLPQVTSLYTTNGKWALVAQTETHDLAEFDAVLTRIGKIPGVLIAETCLLLTRVV